MSLSDWMEKFYKTDASTFKGLEASKENTLKAIEHSLEKWKGLKPDVVEKYDLHYLGINSSLTDAYGGRLGINLFSCALCLMFMVKYLGYDRPCLKCPIYLVTGNDCTGAYNEMTDNYNPYPMIELLEKVYKATKEKE